MRKSICKKVQDECEKHGRDQTGENNSWSLIDKWVGR